MKTKFTLLVILIMATMAGSVSAQSTGQKKVRVGLGLEGGLPTGSFGSAYNVGIGGTLRVAIALDESSAVTATTGAMAFIPKSFNGVGLKAQLNIPIKAGYKYMFNSTLYGLGEAGVTIARVYYPTSSGSQQSVSSTSFTYSAGVGAHLGAFDPSIRYEGYSSSGFIGLRLGFNF